MLGRFMILQYRFSSGTNSSFAQSNPGTIEGKGRTGPHTTNAVPGYQKICLPVCSFRKQLNGIIIKPQLQTSTYSSLTGAASAFAEPPVSPCPPQR
eukprot:3314179-Rhodomonas_salina.1